MVQFDVRVPSIRDRLRGPPMGGPARACLAPACTDAHRDPPGRREVAGGEPAATGQADSTGSPGGIAGTGPVPPRDPRSDQMPDDDRDVIEILEHDHREVEQMFVEL